MNTLKPVRLKLAWQGWPKGHIFTAMPAAQAQHMVAAGQCEYVTAAMASPVDRMIRPGDVTTKTARRTQGRAS